MMAGRTGPELVLFVDRIGCDGYGTCAELLPEMITLDEWGYPIMRRDPIPTHLLPYARKAVDSCPVLALRLADPGRVTIGVAPVRTPAVQPAAVGVRSRRDTKPLRTGR